MNIKLENMQSLSEYYDYLRVHPRLCCLFLELTDACNMSCLHCGSRCSQKNADFLPVNSIYSLLDTVAEHYPPENILICLTGGEPLLHPGFFDIVSYIQKKGFPWGMTTNATLIDDACCK